MSWVGSDCCGTKTYNVVQQFFSKDQQLEEWQVRLQEFWPGCGHWELKFSVEIIKE